MSRCSWLYEPKYQYSANRAYQKGKDHTAALLPYFFLLDTGVRIEKLALPSPGRALVASETAMNKVFEILSKKWGLMALL